jgi:hypothetical protein
MGRKRTVGGRPPSGPDGELVSKYPPLTVRIPPDTKHMLEALSALRRVPIWKLVDEAVRTFVVEHIPEPERRLLTQFVKQRHDTANL